MISKTKIEFFIGEVVEVATEAFQDSESNNLYSILVKPYNDYNSQNIYCSPANINIKQLPIIGEHVFVYKGVTAESKENKVRINWYYLNTLPFVELEYLKKAEAVQPTEEEQKAADKYTQDMQEAENEIEGPSNYEDKMIKDLNNGSEVKITGNNQVGDALGSLSYQPFDMANLGKSQEERMIDANTIKEQELQNKSKSNIPFLQNNNNQTNISGSSSTTVGMSSGTSNGDATFDNMAGAVSP